MKRLKDHFNPIKRDLVTISVSRRREDSFLTKLKQDTILFYRKYSTWIGIILLELFFLAFFYLIFSAIFNVQQMQIVSIIFYIVTIIGMFFLLLTTFFKIFK